MYIQDQVSIDQLDDGHLRFFRAIGVDSIHLDLRGGAPAPGRRSGTGSANTSLAQEIRAGKDCTDALAQAREKVEAHGLKLNNIFMPAWEEITLAGPDMDEKIGHWCRIAGERGPRRHPLRGLELQAHGQLPHPLGHRPGRREIQHLRLRRLRQEPPRGRTSPPWTRPRCGSAWSAFSAAAIPAAEKAGVRMALHPNDPPIPEPLGGVAQICSTLEQFRRIFFEIAPSPSNCMLFCQGCMTELLGPEKVYAAIAEMASADKIAWVHFRNVRAQLPRFAEVFIDEGEVDMRRAMEVYRDNGFDGPYMVDHTPAIGPGFGALHGKAYAIGYIRALVEGVYG